MSVERDPKKRRVKPVDNQSLLHFDDLEESSDDSDFRIEDHHVASDEDDSVDSNGEGGKSSSTDEENDSDDGSDLENDLEALKLANKEGLSIADVIHKANLQTEKHLKLNDVENQIQICSGCLGDQSDSVNEIVECDSCGITVHEACYGVSDTGSLASTDSLSPTAPWFCEACKAGVKDPVCELCPNSGGIFKETDVGKWVHLVCALYVPGVAFGEVDKLSSVTLFEMPYSKWGAKSCGLCLDDRYARTGVCIGCDAGMCRTYFHVTCAQREGFLSEAHSEEVDQADPFYAHCKLHSDKTLVKRRKRNYMALQVRTHFKMLLFQNKGHSETTEQVRIQRKLGKQRISYANYKSLKPPPWVPTQKMPRLLTTSASACKRLLKKAELMGIDTVALEMQEAHTTALMDVRKKWHISPAFSVEFIAYYLDRNDRLKDMKDTLEKLVDENKDLLVDQHTLRNRYDELLKQNGEVSKKNIDLKQVIHKFHSAILSACPTKNLPNIEDLGRDLGKPSVMTVPRVTQPMMVPTAAALKMGVGFPLNNLPAGRMDRVLSSHATKQGSDPLMLNECGICRQVRDQHLLAKCDTCHLYYHLNCLNPPLTRLPKKSKLYGWQCSECDKSSDSEVEEVKTPRRSKSLYSRNNKSDSADHSKSDPETVVTPRSEAVKSDVEGGTPKILKSPKIRIKTMKTAPIITAQAQSTPIQDLSFISCNSMTSDPLSIPSIPLTTRESNGGLMVEVHSNGVSSEGHKAKKRRREKHRSRYSPELGGGSSKEHKRKRKKKSLDIEAPHPRITIKIKPIPLPAGEVASESNPQCFYVPKENNDIPPSIPTLTVKKSPSKVSRSPRQSSPRQFSPRQSLPLHSVADVAVMEALAATVQPHRRSEPKVDVVSICHVCELEGSAVNSVKCDECLKVYHFTCLDPPLKKTPKKRGYSWHCADCDPTASE